MTLVDADPMPLVDALARADRLCPPAHPSGKRVLYVMTAGEQDKLLDEQLITADAIGVLAYEVRRLMSEPIYARLMKANTELRDTLARVEDMLPALRSQSRALRQNRGRSKVTVGQAIAIEGIAQQLELTLRGEP